MSISTDIADSVVREGFRAGVTIVVGDGRGKILLCERADGGWQFPQGGIERGESEEQAMWRELYEEVGLTEQNMKILHTAPCWLHYTVPKFLWRRPEDGRRYLGQAQRWFLLYFGATDTSVVLDLHHEPEFVSWRWTPYWYPLHLVVDFKNAMYRRGLSALAAAHSQFCRQRIPSC